GDDLQKMLGEEAAMERIGSVLDEVFGLQGVGTLDSDVRDHGIERALLDLEHESRGKSGVATLGVTEEEAIGLERVRREQETADRDSGEMVGAFQYGWSSMAAFGRTIADKEAGDVAFDEALIESGEEMGETEVGDAAAA